MNNLFRLFLFYLIGKKIKIDLLDDVADYIVSEIRVSSGINAHDDIQIILKRKEQVFTLRDFSFIDDAKIE